MKILAVDTSATVATVAVTEDWTLLAEYSLNHKKTHSQKLMPMMHEILGSLELKPSDVDAFAASTGPGSFTGLRIGVTTVKAMAYALKKPVISVPTLDALAYNIPITEAIVCPMMDARNQQVYTAIYSWKEGGLSRDSECMGILVSDLIEMIKEKGNSAIFVGDGAELHRELLQKELQDQCRFAPGNLMLQRASSVAVKAFIQASQGAVEDAFDMVPFYLRKSQAEREYEKKQKSAHR